ncbi:hypothetical protein GGS20DRAFT_582486 [Poronia punctata]|nr:hypothetical protein GGS20DRAFT_582486 [Poronia punctata]
MSSSSSSSTKYDWLVVVPDKPGKQADRLKVRAQHFEGIRPLAEAGFLKTGGAIFNDIPEGTDASKYDFYGSSLVCVAESKEEVLEVLKKDIYATSGVWDLENAQIWPPMTAEEGTVFILAIIVTTP